MARLLIVEGNPPENALALFRMTGRTAAGGYAAALREIDPDVEIEYAKPYFSDHDLDALDMAAFDGVAVTGSGVAWSAEDERARPFWDLFEKVFAAGAPAFGSCWGMQCAAVTLGGAAAAGPNGVEAGFARKVAAGDHPMHAGRRAAFDVIAMHRDDVIRAPDGAEVTAWNDHTAIQAFAYDRGGVSFWGVQYHPECTLDDIGFWFSRRGDAQMRAAGREIARAGEDPVAHARLCVKHGIGLDILDRAYHLTELRNWLRLKVEGRAAAG